MTPHEMYNEMLTRCDDVWAFMRQEGVPNQAAVGAIIQTLDGGFLAAELAMTPDGLATITARAFDRHGDQINVGVLQLDQAVMVTA